MLSFPVKKFFPHLSFQKNSSFVHIASHTKEEKNPPDVKHFSPFWAFKVEQKTHYDVNGGSADIFITP